MALTNCSVIKVYYENPYADTLYQIMINKALTDDEKLLDNIEKILPVSKILYGRDNKKIQKISYEKNLSGLTFNLYFN